LIVKVVLLKSIVKTVKWDTNKQMCKEYETGKNSHDQSQGDYAELY